MNVSSVFLVILVALTFTGCKRQYSHESANLASSGLFIEMVDVLRGAPTLQDEFPYILQADCIYLDDCYDYDYPSDSPVRGFDLTWLGHDCVKGGNDESYSESHWQNTELLCAYKAWNGDIKWTIDRVERLIPYAVETFRINNNGQLPERLLDLKDLVDVSSLMDFWGRDIVYNAQNGSYSLRSSGRDPHTIDDDIIYRSGDGVSPRCSDTYSDIGLNYNFVSLVIVSNIYYNITGVWPDSIDAIMSEPQLMNQLPLHRYIVDGYGRRLILHRSATCDAIIITAQGSSVEDTADDVVFTWEIKPQLALGSIALTLADLRCDHYLSCPDITSK